MMYKDLSIALDKRGYPHDYFYFTTKTYIVGTPQPLYNTIVGVHSINLVTYVGS